MHQWTKLSCGTNARNRSGIVRLLVFSPGAVLCLPHDWDWLFRANWSRIGRPDAAYDWQFSGWSRLTFPLRRAVRGQLLFEAGTEDFGYIDQIATYSARTYGAGALVRTAPGQCVRSDCPGAS